MAGLPVAVNVPIRPVPSNDKRSPFTKLLDEAMRLNMTEAVRKLYALIGDNKKHKYTTQQVITLASLTEEEILALANNSAINKFVYPDSDNTTITSNGVSVVHVHGNQFRTRSAPTRPLIIRNNNGAVHIKNT